MDIKLYAFLILTIINQKDNFRNIPLFNEIGQLMVRQNFKLSRSSNCGTEGVFVNYINKFTTFVKSTGNGFLYILEGPHRKYFIVFS